LATSVAAIFNVVMLGTVLARRGLMRLDRLLLDRASRMLAAALLMAAALAAFDHVLFSHPTIAGVTKVLALAGLVAVGLGAYAVALQLLGAYDIRDARRMLRRPALRTPDGSAISPGTPQT
jgi:putative peptidoglycan lipid II flippase